jgi:xylose isomerase
MKKLMIINNCSECKHLQNDYNEALFEFYDDIKIKYYCCYDNDNKILIKNIKDYSFPNDCQLKTYKE